MNRNFLKNIPFSKCHSGHFLQLFFLKCGFFTWESSICNSIHWSLSTSYLLSNIIIKLNSLSHTEKFFQEIHAQSRFALNLVHHNDGKVIETSFNGQVCVWGIWKLSVSFYALISHITHHKTHKTIFNGNNFSARWKPTNCCIQCITRRHRCEINQSNENTWMAGMVRQKLTTFRIKVPSSLHHS